MVCTVMAAQTKLPTIIAVYPSGESAPENLLRISIVFAEPPECDILPQITLQQSDGTPIEDPFLPQELWSPDRCRLTILLHPGRVKSGLAAHKSFGRTLQAGNEVFLMVDRKMVKSWVIAAANREALQPSQWEMSLLKKHTRSELKVVFNVPIDASGKELIAVVDSKNSKIEGATQLNVGEQQWIFIPNYAWQNESYYIVVHPKLEDAAGNITASAFEHSVGEVSKNVVIKIPLTFE